MGGAGEEMGQETASDMSGWWRKHQVGVTRREEGGRQERETMCCLKETI